MKQYHAKAKKKVIVPNKTNRKDEQLNLPNLVVASPKGSRTNVVTQLGVTPFHHFYQMIIPTRNFKIVMPVSFIAGKLTTVLKF